MHVIKADGEVEVQLNSFLTSTNNKLAKKVSIDLISPDKCVLTVNQFAPLANLEDETANIQNSSEHASTQSASEKTNLPRKGNKIPNLVNGILNSHIDFPRITHIKDKTLKVKTHPAKDRPMKPKH